MISWLYVFWSKTLEIVMQRLVLSINYGVHSKEELRIISLNPNQMVINHCTPPYFATMEK